MQASMQQGKPCRNHSNFCSQLTLAQSGANEGSVLSCCLLTGPHEAGMAQTGNTSSSTEPASATETKQILSTNLEKQ